MIKFFRKIRQRLLAENKFSKYLIYAIGEIFLVVLGILIALSINSWNTYLKDRIKEKEILNGIVINLELNKNLILERIKVMKVFNEKADLILKLQDKQIIYSDSLDRSIFTAIALPYIFNLPNQSFEYLKNEGFDIILNENKRDKIIELFNVNYNLTNIRFDKIANRHSHHYQYIDENFKRETRGDGQGGYLRPYYVDKTFNDNYFFSIISSYIASREQLIHYLQVDLDQTEKLLTQLKQNDF